MHSDAVTETIDAAFANPQEDSIKRIECSYDTIFMGKKQNKVKTVRQLSFLKLAEEFVNVYAREDADKSYIEHLTDFASMFYSSPRVLKDLINLRQKHGENTAHQFSFVNFSHFKKGHMLKMGVNVVDNISVYSLTEAIENWGCVQDPAWDRHTDIKPQQYHTIFLPESPNGVDVSKSEANTRVQFKAFLGILEPPLLEDGTLLVHADELVIGARNRGANVAPINIQHEHVDQKEYTTIHHTFASGTMDLFCSSTQGRIKELVESVDFKAALKEWNDFKLSNLSDKSNLVDFLKNLNIASGTFNDLIQKEFPDSDAVCVWDMIVIELKKMETRFTLCGSSKNNKPYSEQASTPQTECSRADGVSSQQRLPKINFDEWIVTEADNPKVWRDGYRKLGTLHPEKSIDNSLVDLYMIITAEKSTSDVIYMPSIYLPDYFQVQGKPAGTKRGEAHLKTRYQQLAGIAQMTSVPDKVASVVWDGVQHCVIVAVRSTHDVYIIGRDHFSCGRKSRVGFQLQGINFDPEAKDPCWKETVDQLWRTIAEFNGWPDESVNAKYAYHHTDWCHDPIDSDAVLCHVLNIIIQEGFNVDDQKRCILPRPECTHRIRWAMFTDISESSGQVHGALYTPFLKAKTSSEKWSILATARADASTLPHKAKLHRVETLKAFEDAAKECEFCKLDEEEPLTEDQLYQAAQEKMNQDAASQNTIPDNEISDQDCGPDLPDAWRDRLRQYSYQAIAECMAIYTNPSLRQGKIMKFIISTSNEWLFGAIDCSENIRPCYHTQTLRIINANDIRRAVFLTRAWIMMTPEEAFERFQEAHGQDLAHPERLTT